MSDLVEKLSFSSGQFCSSNPLQIKYEMNNEIIECLSMELGFTTRNMNVGLTGVDYRIGHIYAEKFNYQAAAISALVYVAAIERLAKVKVSERAKLIRIVLCELNRISNHILYLARTAMITGQKSEYYRGLFVRERFLDIFETYCGSRMLFGAVQLGGVSADISDGIIFQIEKNLRELDGYLAEYSLLCLKNTIFRQRLSGLAVLSQADTERFNLTGPNARASGSDFDLRKSDDVLGYAMLDPVGEDFDTSGDALARLLARISEIRISEQYIKNAVGTMPKQEFRRNFRREFSIARGSVTAEVESTNGTLAVTVFSDGTSKPSMVNFMAPSRFILSAMEQVACGNLAEDLDLLFANFDIFIPEVDA